MLLISAVVLMKWMDTDESASAEMRYRLFEVDAALVDRLVPMQQRQPDRTAAWQISEISFATLGLLLPAKDLSNDSLADKRRIISRWPMQAESLTGARPKNGDFLTVSIGGSLGLRKKGGELQARIEFTIAADLDSGSRMSSKVFYEGRAPTARALIYLMPVRGANAKSRYLVFTLETADILSYASQPQNSYYFASGQSVDVVSSGTRTHYVFYYPGEFSRSLQGTSEPRANTWQESGSFSLQNGRTFGFVRASNSPEFLTINGREYDLRSGRVFVLRDSGQVQVLPLQPGLITQSNWAAFARTVAETAEAGASGPPAVEGPADLAKLQGQLEIAQTQLRDLLKTHAPTHLLVGEVQQSIKVLQH